MRTSHKVGSGVASLLVLVLVCLLCGKFYVDKADSAAEKATREAVKTATENSADRMDAIRKDIDKDVDSLRTAVGKRLERAEEATEKIAKSVGNVVEVGIEVDRRLANAEKNIGEIKTSVELVGRKADTATATADRAEALAKEVQQAVIALANRVTAIEDSLGKLSQEKAKLEKTAEGLKTDLFWAKAQAESSRAGAVARLSALDKEVELLKKSRAVTADLEKLKKRTEALEAEKKVADLVAKEKGKMERDSGGTYTYYYRGWAWRSGRSWACR